MQILDTDDSWKMLMASIPSENNPDLPKYTVEHIQLIEKYGLLNRRLAGDILLDEWSTSGRVRPKVETLFVLLQKCELFRAADYVATEILSIPIPRRPTEGPAKEILPILNPDESELLEQPFDNLHITNIPEPISNDALSPLDANLNALVEKLNNYDHSHGNLIDFSIEVIEKVTNNFSESLNIGSGSFGTVYSLDLRPKGPKLAIKLLHPTSSVVEEQFVTEIRVLSE
jgi:hypothetical protein